ncbi:hypothetical protein HYP07_gp038 [Vibrio phage JSF3]|uniref:hypothetical protein n=1 Tax=Vibrio phage JSF3 TaxID=1916111 RepID=UPI000B61748C|nr:hypothetical protein HYP07_gp038 [Vibrio phage JSF3]APD18050.1 hypothetical protein [Vibrio phage JSF3]
MSLERIDNFSTSNETVFVDPHKGFIELTLCPVAEPEESVSVSYSCSSEDIGKLIAALQRAKDKFDNA